MDSCTFEKTYPHDNKNVYPPINNQTDRDSIDEFIDLKLPVFNPLYREANGLDPFNYKSDTNIQFKVNHRRPSLDKKEKKESKKNKDKRVPAKSMLKPQPPKKKLQLFDPIEEHPTYLIVMNEDDYKKIKKAIFNKLKKKMMIQNNIHIMLDTYNYRFDNKIIFYNNDRKYKIVYKRYNLNDRSLYIPIEEYSKCYLDFKTRICTSVVESLGVKSIEFKHNEFTQTLLNIDASVGASSIKSRAKVSSEEKDNYSNNDTKLYNKGHCNFLFYKPKDFEDKITELNSYIMDYKDFENDIELKNLIRSRLVGNLIEYDLKYEIDFMNAMEVDLVTNFLNNVNAGVNLKKMATQKLNINLRIKFYKYSYLINNDNIQLNERCLQLLVNHNDDEDDKEDEDDQENKEIEGEGIVPKKTELIISPDIEKKITMMKKKNNLLCSFIDRYMEKSYIDHKININALNNYKMFKIADQKYLNSLIKNVKTMEDLSSNSFFMTTISSVLFSTLLTFDNEGLIKIQKIYSWIMNNNSMVEHIPRSITEETELAKCSNIRCDDPDCSNVIKPIVTVFSYIIRMYNNNNPENILTYGLRNQPELTKVLRYISLNLRHLTTYEMLTDFVNKHINMYRYKCETDFKNNCEIDTHGNIMIIYKKKLRYATAGFFDYMHNLFN